MKAGTHNEKNCMLKWWKMSDKEISLAIVPEALRELCIQYDREYGIYNPNLYEGRALYNFFLNAAFGIVQGIDVDTWEAACDKKEEEITEDCIYGN